ncbi:MAG TPA: Ig-like domain-containing protein [Terracidiphilus sp.]
MSSVKPASGATQVPLNSTIQVTFSSAADSSTVNATDVAVTDPKPVAGTLNYDSSTDTVTFTPSAALVANSTYTITVSGVKSSSGVAMSAPFQAKFATVMPPPPPAGGGGGGGTGGGGGGTATPTTQYQAPLTPEIGLGTSFNGQVTVDTTGNTAITLTHAAVSTVYTLQFCPGFDAGATTIPAPACFDITTVTTDASGNAGTTAKFPKPGNWAGDFTLNDSTGKIKYQTFLGTNSTSQTYMATLLPDTTTNGGAVTTFTKQEPLKSGTVALKNGSLQFTLQGASPNTTYYTDDSENIYMNSSGTYQMTTFTTDASGNGTSTASLNDGSGGDLFQVGPNAMPATSAGYIGGFAIPQ